MTHSQRHLEGQVVAFFKANGLDSQPNPIIIGVSGGTDSLCLMYSLHRVSAGLRLKLHVAHLNHCLRGADSDKDADFVAATAKDLKLPFTIGRENVHYSTSAHSKSLEEKARDVRYKFLCQVAKQENAFGIAVGHTADDQAETILLHLLRGSGIRGLIGMNPLRELKPKNCMPITLYRPLLGATRSQTESYCKNLGLSPRTDYTNKSTHQRRNSLRLELIPFLKQYNPKVDKALLRLSSSASLDLDFIDLHVKQVWKDVVSVIPDGIQINQDKIIDIHPSLRRHVLQKVLQEVLGDRVDIESSHITSLENLLDKPTGKSLDLPRALRAEVKYKQCTVKRIDAAPYSKAISIKDFQIQVPGMTAVPGWKFTTSITDVTTIDSNRAECQTYLDLDTLQTPITVRSRSHGDWFIPLGMNGRKKLQDFFVDAKVPRMERDNVPILMAGNDVAWVVGFRIDERVKVRDSTKRILRVTAERD